MPASAPRSGRPGAAAPACVTSCISTGAATSPARLPALQTRDPSAARKAAWRSGEARTGSRGRSCSGTPRLSQAPLGRPQVRDATLCGPGRGGFLLTPGTLSGDKRHSRHRPRRQTTRVRVFIHRLLGSGTRKPGVTLHTGWAPVSTQRGCLSPFFSREQRAEAGDGPAHGASVRKAPTPRDQTEGGASWQLCSHTPPRRPSTPR